ncbi:hypothetical protein PV04_10004 [Phialophora macrospora]|uniref:Uncharacterized protein n=1 Tax=Phialophora macrospora TaxID=1851006 RepID=A0A0D2FSV0_9EURO|nr:hypothetical protein PV04_10004 [Phialophora macrospora]
MPNGPTPIEGSMSGRSEWLWCSLWRTRRVKQHGNQDPATHLALETTMQSIYARFKCFQPGVVKLGRPVRSDTVLYSQGRKKSRRVTLSSGASNESETSWVDQDMPTL